ncbi:glycosyltransferase [uncultured Prochlorococcus sp.]|uniref:glycosyltransferase n=1 Tax=uncultured Prochlorococcus sp. TaxID=159733 RepID=UPI002588094B|nr:glycosyltransferase [uncultured Prochlorococcus sp.]
MNKKVILLYPYFNGTSGAFNRYLLLKDLIKKINIPVKLILIKEKKHNSIFLKTFFRLIKFLKVELLIFYYSILKNYFFITDFNPSILALFSSRIFIQIHDLSWEKKEFARHNSFSYFIFLYFIRNYSNILTVSKTSKLAIEKFSGRKKEVSYLYNSVNRDFIRKSNKIANNELKKNDFIYKALNLDLPNIIYIATLTPRKCHLDLLEALSTTENLFNVNLVGYPTNKKIRKLIEANKTINGNRIRSNINYFPKLSQKDLCNLLLYSSAYISTSKNEGFGIPVLEADLYEIPLIVRDIDINRELFPNSKFFKSNNELSKFLDKIKPLNSIEIKKRKESLSKINEENLMPIFNYSTLSNKLQNLFESH